MSRHVVTMHDGVDMPTYYTPATPADIAAWLHEYPKEAVEIVRGLKVAHAWTPFREGFVRYDALGSDIASAFDMRVLKGARCRWEIQGAVFGYANTLVLAKHDADAALIASGWSLA